MTTQNLQLIGKPRTVAVDKSRPALIGEGQDVDLTEDLQALIDDASTLGAATGQRVDVSLHGVIAVTGITMRSNVGLVASDGDKAVLYLLAGSNRTVIKGLNFDTLTGTNTAAAVQNFALKNLEIDGNKANNASPGALEGYGVQIYGRDYFIDGLYIKNTKRVGLWLEYSNGTFGISPFNGRCYSVTTDKTDEEGIVLAISDIHGGDFNIRSPGQAADNTYPALRLKKGAHLANINVWRGGTETNKHSYCVYLEDLASTSKLYQVTFETAGTASIFSAADDVVITGISYNCVGDTHAIVEGDRQNYDLEVYKGTLGHSNQVAVQIGTVGASSQGPSTYTIRGTGLPRGLFNNVNNGGGNIINGSIYLESGHVTHTSAFNAMDDVRIVGQALLTADRRSYRSYPCDANVLTAFGTDVNTLTRINRSHTIITTNDTTGTNGAKFNENPTPGDTYYITNVSTVSVWIYPHPAGNFVGKSANVGVQIPPNCTWRFEYLRGGTGWGVMQGTAP